LHKRIPAIDLALIGRTNGHRFLGHAACRFALDT
jgi:hypothetical protein